MPTNLYDNFQDGDLLYGMQKLRANFIQQLRGKLQPKCDHCIAVDAGLAQQDAQKQSIQSRIPMPSAMRTPTEEHPVTVDSFNNAIKPLLRTGDALVPLPSVEYHDFAAIQQHFEQVYLVLMPHYFANLDKNRLAKACEAAVFKPEVRIHFCINNSLIDAALGFTNKERYFKGFTAKELRFIYKHWDELRSMDKIYFYNPRGERIAPPWEDPHSHRFNDWPQKAPGQTKQVFAHSRDVFFAYLITNLLISLHLLIK